MMIIKTYSILVFHCYFGGGWYVSGDTFVMLQLVPAHREQLVDYYGVSILLDISNMLGQAVFYFLYGNVPLFNNNNKHHA